jgi:hypothetical protein
MARLLMVAYRPHPHQRDSVLKLLYQQYLLVSELGLISKRQPWVMESANGELVYVAAFDDAGQVDRCWENETFQDIDSQLLQLADMVPVHSLQEASGPFLDMEELELSMIAAMVERGPPASG